MADIEMPGDLNGMDLAWAGEASWPPLAVVGLKKQGSQSMRRTHSENVREAARGSYWSATDRTPNSRLNTSRAVTVAYRELERA